MFLNHRLVEGLINFLILWALFMEVLFFALRAAHALHRCRMVPRSTAWRDCAKRLLENASWWFPAPRCGRRSAHLCA